MTGRLVWEVAAIGLRRLWHGKLELLLVFVVPVVFFTIFALIFTGGVSSGRTKKIKAAITDLDGSPQSAALVARLVTNDAIRVITDDTPASRDPELDEYDRARDRILHGRASVSLVVPEGWSKTFQDGVPGKVFVLYDSADQIAPKLMTAIVQESLGATLAEWADEQAAELAARAPPGAPQPTAFAIPAGPPPVEAIDVLSSGKSNPVIAMYAAGIAVMFLLFSATGAAGSLIEEEETQTLERLLASRLTMSHVLAGKWLNLTLVGAGQIVVMFGWAQVVFGLDVLARWDAFLLLTGVTAAAAAALALMLAAACRTRAQLNAVSVILVLTMSALGGSMVPRYVMSDTMQEIGRVTFNAWAIDGYTKLFWRDLPTAELWPELATMSAFCVAMLLIARVLATRWEGA
ncbi:MAG: ABC transporter permease [Planctomycetota bacterium]